MANCTEHFIKESDNVITLTLTEDGSGITGAYTDLDIDLIDPVDDSIALNISRGTNGSGVALSVTTGVLTIKPGFLTEDVTVLENNKLYKVLITVKSATNEHGAVFGGGDSDTKIRFLVTSNTAPT
jgi:hypothetical protein